MGAGFMLPSIVFYHLAMTARDYLTFNNRQGVNQTVSQIARDGFGAI